MDITYINNRSVKISLTCEDLSERGLSADTLNYSGVHAKHFLWELLDRAHDETGFDAENARLLVRVFPSPDGGCELFVTKRQDSLPVQTEPDGDRLIVVPENDDILHCLCKRMKTEGFRGSSSLFCDEKDRLILVFGKRRRLPSYISMGAASREKTFDFAGEYGTVFAASPERLAYLEEHCRLLCAENAVEEMSR